MSARPKIGDTGITVTELCHGTLIMGKLQANQTPEEAQPLRTTNTPREAKPIASAPQTKFAGNSGAKKTIPTARMATKAVRAFNPRLIQRRFFSPEEESSKQ